MPFAPQAASIGDPHGANGGDARICWLAGKVCFVEWLYFRREAV